MADNPTMLQITDTIPEQTTEESPFLKNFAEDLKDADLQKIGRRVVEDYKSDLGSREGLNIRINEWKKLYVSLKETKNTPWNNAANVKLPILSTACLQFHARVYDTLLPSKEIAKCWATDGKSVETAERCQNFMNYQLTDQMEEWMEDMDAMLLILPLYGSGVKKTYYDPYLRRDVSKTLRMDEFVAPYGVKRLEDAPRKTHVYEMYLNDIKIKGRAGIWINLEGVEDSDAGVTIDIPGKEHRDTSDESTGVQPSAEQRDLPRNILEQHRTLDLDGDDIEEWYAVTVDLETENVLRIESLEYVDQNDGETKKFEYFTAYNFIPNPESWMGHGFGHLLEHLNVSVNTLSNQLIDSGTLANNISGFYNKRSGIEDGDISFDMGQFNGLDIGSDDINKALYVLKFDPPSNVLFTLMQMLHNYAKELSSVSDSMLGKLPPSDTTATSMLTVMEQGLKLFSTISQRIHRGLKKELKKIFILNSHYIDEDKYFMVQDSTSANMIGYELGKDDFRNPIDVVPVSDPNITSRAEKLIKSRQAYELLRNDPAIANDVEAVYRLQYNLLDALEVKNIDQFLKKPEPQEPPDLRPEEEEAQFLREVGVQPLPQQDHGAHLDSHNAFKESEFSQQLTPQGGKLLEGHIRETISMFYLQLKQSEEDINGATNGGAIQGVAGAPLLGDNAGGLGAEAGVPGQQPG